MKKCPKCRKLFDRAVRMCVTCAVATIPVAHTYVPAETGEHAPITVTVLRQPLRYIPLQTADSPEMPHLPDADFTTNREIATNMSTAVRVHVIDPETSDG